MSYMLRPGIQVLHPYFQFQTPLLDHTDEERESIFTIACETLLRCIKANQVHYA